MRLAAIGVLVLSLVSVGWSQKPAEAVHKGAWELGVWAGGGSGLGARTDWHFFNAGARVAKVLTGERGGGWARGHLLWAADIIPVYYVMQPYKNTFGAGFTPIILNWTFTGHKKVVPFLEGGAGVLFTGYEVPPGTSNVNFTPQAGFGVHIFTRPKQAVTITGRYEHISNAGQTTPNPGINATLQFRLGYTWFK